MPDSKLINFKKSLLNNIDFTISLAYNGEVPPSGSTNYHSSSYYSLWYVVRGEVKIYKDGQIYIIEPGNWVVTSPGFKRQQSFSSETELISIHFDIKKKMCLPLIKLEKQFIIKKELPELKQASLDLVECIEGIDFDNADTLSSVSFNCASYKWLNIFYLIMVDQDIISKEIELKESRLEDPIKVLESMPYSGSIPYDKLKKMCGLSRVQIDRLFHQHLGLSPKQYHEQQLLRTICEELDQSSNTLKQICYQYGFATPQHFSAWFKKLTGDSPKKYRALKQI